MNYSRILIHAFLILMSFGAGVAHAQKPAPSTSPRPFEPTEELIYEGEFSRSLLRKLDIADFKFTAGRKRVDHANKSSGSPAQQGSSPYFFLFTGEVTSKGFFSKLFNLRFRERVESIVDAASFSVRNTKRIDEQGKRLRNSEAVFDPEKGKVVWTERDPKQPSREPRTVTSDFSGTVHDVLSAIYFLRTQPLTVGKSLELNISDSGQVYQVPIRVVERKKMKTLLGKVNAVRVEADLFGPDRMIDHEGEFSIWFTDDARRIPVSARVKNEFGTFDIKLKKVVRNPAGQEYLTKQQ